MDDMTDNLDATPPKPGFQGWVERNRAKIWIWGIGCMALAGVGVMFAVVMALIIFR